MSIFAARLRIVAAIALSASALFITGCTTSVQGSPSPRSDVQSAPSSSTAARPSTPQGGCRVTVSGSGSISMSGGGGRAVTTNGVTSFSCRNGPLITIKGISPSGVTLAAEGGADTVVAEGSTATVATYQVTVASVDGEKTVLQVVPA